MGVLAKVLRGVDKSAPSICLMVLPFALIQCGSHMAIFMRVVEDLKQHGRTEIVLYVELLIRGVFSILPYTIVILMQDKSLDQLDHWFWMVTVSAGLTAILTFIIFCDVV